MNYLKSQRQFYNEHRQFVLKELNITQNQYNYFRRIGDQLHSLYEQECNGTIDEQTYEEKVKFWSDKSDDKAKELGIYIFYQTDPRGATIYLDKKPIAYDAYNKAQVIY